MEYVLIFKKIVTRFDDLVNVMVVKTTVVIVVGNAVKAVKVHGM